MDPPMYMAIFMLFFFFFKCDCIALRNHSQPLGQSSKEYEFYMQLPLNSAAGPESIAFDCIGGGPYTGVLDGRILKWEGRFRRWKNFAFPSPNWRKNECNGGDKGSMCGRPLGLRFSKVTCNLYIADAYFGLMMVGPEGGIATQLATAAQGIHFNLTNSLDIDEETGLIYFTDSSTRFQLRDYLLAIVSGDRTGRLMKYDPRTKEVEILINDLAFANGVSISKDRTFVVVAESGSAKITRFWLKGPKAKTVDVFCLLPGFADNITRNMKGEFWVAIYIGLALFDEMDIKFSRNLEPFSSWPKALRINEKGMILDVLRGENAVELVTEVHQHFRNLWVGTVDKPYVGIYY